MATDASTLEETMPNWGTPRSDRRPNRLGKRLPFAAASGISAQIVISATANRLIGADSANEPGRLRMPTPMMLPIRAVTRDRPSVPSAACRGGMPSLCPVGPCVNAAMTSR
jgi:hypothetical protein